MMNYEITVYDTLSSSDPNRNEVGSYEMNADSEFDASNRFPDEPEYHRILMTLPDDRRGNTHVSIRNKYLDRMAASIVIRGTTDRIVEKEDFKHMKPGTLILRNGNGKPRYLNSDKMQYVRLADDGRHFETEITCNLTGSRGEDVVRLPECRSVTDVPFYMDQLNGTFRVINISSITVSVMDGNEQKPVSISPGPDKPPVRDKVMHAFGEPSRYYNDHPVWDITIDGPDIQCGIKRNDERHRIGDKSVEDDFARAVADIPVDEISVDKDR